MFEVSLAAIWGLLATDLFIVVMVTLVAVTLFVSEQLPVEMVALLVAVTLMATGVLTPKQGLAGFSSSATIAIACMFVLSEGLRQTGLVSEIGSVIARVFMEYDWRIALTGMMIFSALLSGFINNTAVVAIFLPVMLGAARDADLSPTKVLMPLSFAAMFGGVCTLLGTSTNLLVSSILTEHGPEPIGMFELAPMGLIFFGVGLVYMITVGDWLMPERGAETELTDSFEMGEYLTEVEIQDLEAMDPAAYDLIQAEGEDVDVLGVIREDVHIQPPEGGVNLEEGDILRIRAPLEAIQRVRAEPGMELRPESALGDVEITSQQTELFEAVVAPDSTLDGRTLRDADFADTFQANILAIRRETELLHTDVMDEKLQGGDVLLMQAPQDRLPQLQKSTAFVVISEVGQQNYERDKMLWSIGIVASVMGAAAFGLAPVVVCALTGCLAMIFSGILTLEDAYGAINWEVIVLLGGIIPLGTALEVSGGVGYISSFLRNVLGAYGPMAVLAGFYFLTVVLTSMMSNQATAVLFTPLAIETANQMGVNPRPFVFAVAFAASASFMTPVGYQTNTLIYSAGQYEFKDFAVVGTPLTILFGIVATFCIPWIWPLHP